MTSLKRITATHALRAQSDILLSVQSYEMRGSPPEGGDDKFYSCLEKKLVLAVSGYLELHGFTNCNYHNFDIIRQA